MPIRIKGINHLGIAAKDPEAARRFFRDVLGLPLVGEETVADQKTHTVMFEAANGVPTSLEESSSRLELVIPADGQGPIADFLTKKGGGIHHVALRVDDIDEALAHLKDKQVKLIDQTPRRGAHDTLIIFVHPHATGGILVELVEERAASNLK